MSENDWAGLILADLTPVWDISGILIERGLKIKYGDTNDVFSFPEFKNIIEHNKLNGNLEKLKNYPNCFYSWMDRSIFINVTDYIKKKEIGYNAPLHEIGHACHHLIYDDYPNLARDISYLFKSRLEKKRFIDKYSGANEKEFFAQYFMHYHNRKFSLHPVVKTNWELKIFDGEMFIFIAEILKTFTSLLHN